MTWDKSKSVGVIFALAAIVCALSATALAQSTDQSLPTPVLANEISGTIKPLDLGDPRLTRHFYAFAAAPGDLQITVDSRNLNGDVDVFTAITMRPLVKTSLYASSQSGEVTKAFYLRAHQILILRVEARTPNDEPGTYRVRFGGTFEPFSGGIPVAESSSTESETEEKAGANRLSSVGANIPRPPREVTETPEPTPSPEKSAEKTEEEAAVKKTTPPRTTTRRTTGRNARTRPAPSRPSPTKKTESAAKTESDKSTKEVSKPSEEPATEKATEKEATPEKPKTQELQLPPAGARLLIEQKDGTRIDRPMSTIRRVTVEAGLIVIVLRTGKIERVRMMDIVRMAIEPQ